MSDRSSWEQMKARAPSDEQRQRWANDLAHRAQIVRADGWDDYRYVWSSGEVSGTAVVLRDVIELGKHNETEFSAMETWATNLWGINGGAEDTAAGLPRTVRWFDAIRATLA